MKVNNIHIFKKIPLYLLIFGLFISPFVFWPWAYVAYEIPRVWFIERWIEAMVIIFLFSFLKFKKIKKQDSIIFLLVMVFFFLIVTSSFFGVDLAKSIFGNYYRRDGLLTYFHFIGLFILIGLFWQDSWEKVTVLAISLGSFLSSIWSIYLGIRLYILKDLTLNGWQGAIGGFFSQPQFLAGYLLITLPFVYYWLCQQRNRWLTMIFLAVQLIAIGLTFSFIANMIALIFIGLILYKKVKNKYLKKTVMIFLFAFFLFAGAYIKDKISINIKNDQGYFAQSRQRIAVKLILASFKKPILGWGWANVDYAFESVDWPFRFGNDIYLDKGHSILLEILTTTGVIGLIVYLGIIGRTIYLLINKIKLAKKDYWMMTLLSALLIYIFHSQTNIISIGEEIFFWFILGVASQIEI